LLDGYYTQKFPLEYLRYVPAPLKKLGPLSQLQGSSTELPSSKIFLQKIPAAADIVLDRITSGAARSAVHLRSFKVFDRWIARQVERIWPSAVIGYEPSCTETFTVARKLGITCVLDAASLHFRLQDKVRGVVDGLKLDPVEREIRDRKSREIELADWIFCASPFAKESYVQSGVPPEKIVVQPLGCDLARFFPAPAGSRSGNLRIAFAGVPGRYKGFDLLLRALQTLWARNVSVELHVFGNEGAARAMGAMPVGGQLVLHGSVPHAELADKLRLMDCVVLPSLFDSFGMIVVEAMASGVPVMASDMTGGKMAIVEGRSGWILPASDEGKWMERIAQLAANPDIARSMAQACVQDARPYDWAYYHQRIQGFFLNHKVAQS